MRSSEMRPGYKPVEEMRPGKGKTGREKHREKNRSNITRECVLPDGESLRKFSAVRLGLRGTVFKNRTSHIIKPETLRAEARIEPVLHLRPKHLLEQKGAPRIRSDDTWY